MLDVINCAVIPIMSEFLVANNQFCWNLTKQLRHEDVQFQVSRHPITLYNENTG